MKLIYIWDAYCGWCYGFGKIVIPFIEQHPELDYDILSGGLFIGERSQPIAAYPHIPQANQRIADLYGVDFGPSYQEMLTAGQLQLNSLHPALALTYFKEQLPQSKWIAVAKAMQEAFYIGGRSLSDIGLYREIAERFELDRKRVEAELQSVFQSQTSSEFAQARQLGVSSYPTLLLEKEGSYYDVRGQAMTVEELEENLAQLLKG